MELNSKKRTGPVIFSEYKRGDAIKKAVSMLREDILFELRSKSFKHSEK